MSSELALDLFNLYIEMGVFTTMVAEELAALVMALEIAQSEDECLHQLPISGVVNQTSWIVRPGSDAAATIANHLDYVERGLLVPMGRLEGCIISSETVEKQRRDVDELKRQQLQSMQKEKKAVEEDVTLPLEQPSESDILSFRVCLWAFCLSGPKSPHAQQRLAERYEENIKRRQAQAARRTGNIKRLDDNISLLEANDKDLITSIQAPLQAMMETLQAFRSSLLETKKVLHRPSPTTDAFFTPKAYPGRLSDLADEFRQSAQWIEIRVDQQHRASLEDNSKVIHEV